MARMPALAIATALVGLAPHDAEAHRPMRPEAWWPALDAPRDIAEARGVQALRLAPSGRVRVPGGRFTMGSSPADMLRAVALCRREVLRSRCDDAVSPYIRAEGIAHEVRISPFFLDRTEVTVQDYRRCVVVGACSEPGFAPGDARYDRPSFPVTHVRWEDATAYCEWARGRLPTEAEWEYAARGTGGREYPWGNLYNSRLANHGAFAHDETDATDGFIGLAPVGSFPDGATPLGLLDMAGNVSEWVEDVYSLDENGFGYGAEAVADPHADAASVTRRGRSAMGFHVVRGGAYTEGAAWMRGASRGVTALARSASVGFRCAASR